MRAGLASWWSLVWRRVARAELSSCSYLVLVCSLRSIVWVMEMLLGAITVGSSLVTRHAGHVQQYLEVDTTTCIFNCHCSFLWLLILCYSSKAPSLFVKMIFAWLLNKSPTGTFVNWSTLQVMDCNWLSKVEQSSSEHGQTSLTCLLVPGAGHC